MAIDLSMYSAAELDALIAEASKQKKVAHQKELDSARRKVAEYAQSLGYTVEELFGGRKTSETPAKRLVKYRNPADPTQTWSGRGKPANWFKQALASGMTREDLQV